MGVTSRLVLEDGILGIFSVQDRGHTPHSRRRKTVILNTDPGFEEPICLSLHPIVDVHQKTTVRWIVQPYLGNLSLSPKCHSLHTFASVYKAILHALTYQSSRLYRNSAKLCVCLRHPSPLPPSVALALLHLDFSPR